MIEEYRDRVRGLAWFPPDRIEPAAQSGGKGGNFRTHNAKQRGVLQGLLKELGVTGGVVAWVPDEAARLELRALPPRDLGAFAAWRAAYAGPVRLFDGHLRRSEIQKQALPVVVTDLDEVEARTALLTFDAVGSLAKKDKAALRTELARTGRAVESGTEELLLLLWRQAAVTQAGQVQVVEVGDAPAQFFLSARGPVQAQADAIEVIRTTLAALPGVTVEVGLVGLAR